jgi:hypothetical protein
LVAVAGAACSPPQPPSPFAEGLAEAAANETAPVAGRNGELISAEELDRVTVSNAYEAVLQLRPLWLHSRGRRSGRALTTEIIVAQNGRYFGPVTTLRQFDLQAVKELRYMDGSEAGAFVQGLGSRHVEAAIIVVLR